MNRRVVATVVLMTLLTVPAVAGTDPKAAPDLSLSTRDGQTLRLADLKGHVVLLDFFASWCVPCRKSFPQIEALYKELRERGLEVVAINVDDQARKANAFLSQYSYSMPIVLDPGGRAAKAFDLQAMPSTAIIDRAGTVRFAHIGYTDKTIGQYRAEILELLGAAE